jgi:hypothetical protein
MTPIDIIGVILLIMLILPQMFLVWRDIWKLP